MQFLRSEGGIMTRWKFKTPRAQAPVIAARIVALRIDEGLGIHATIVEETDGGSGASDASISVTPQEIQQEPALRTALHELRKVVLRIAAARTALPSGEIE